MPKDRFKVVEYESLISNPDDVIREVLEFLGVDSEHESLRVKEDRGFVMTPSVWQARQPLYKTSIGRWKNYEPWLGELESLRAVAQI